MKRIILTIITLLIAVLSYSQDTPIKFLGIPVDGSKIQMIMKLEDKGFTKVPGVDCLTGQFNGRGVNVYIQTNKNKVCRIMVAQKTFTDLAGIKTEFNILCDQFENNHNYIDLIGNQSIPEETDISYEMTVHNKNFDAMYYQLPEDMDTAKIEKETKKLIKNYAEENNLDPNNLTTEQERDITNLVFPQVMHNVYSKRPVWFRICKFEGKYYLSLFYDNEFNRAHGEDL